MKPRKKKFIVRIRNRHLFAVDIALSTLTPTLALFIRLDSFSDVLSFGIPLALYTCYALVWRPISLYTYGLYRHDWRYAGIEQWVFLGKGVLLTWGVGILVYALILYPFGLLLSPFPRSIVLIEGLLASILLVGFRFLLYYSFYRQMGMRHFVGTRRVLIAGAGVAGSLIVKEMRLNPHLQLEPVCFVDDDRTKGWKYIHGVQVRGTLKDIPEVVLRNNIQEVIIAMPTAPGKVIRAITDACKQCHVPSKTVPGIFDILEGRAKVSGFREVQIEDLLRRGVIQDEIESVTPFLKDACIMITGAGGSIGAELSRQICKAQPSELILLGHGEDSIFQIAAELRTNLADTGSSVALRTVIADIRDIQRMEEVFRTYRPHIVFHAAAHKHVGLMEKNVPDAITNNVEGTLNLVSLAERSDVKRFVMISTDKAVNPTSVMGVSKRVAELIVQAAALRTGRAFVAVRFGNVLGSNGSVVPIFKRQIAQGGPVLVTDPDVERFFMTIPEAVQLVLQAASIGTGGEVFVLDMGDPIRILDLARDIIRLSGLKEGTDIEIEFSGLTPGEKISEELFFAHEVKTQSAHEKIFVCKTNGKEVSASSHSQDATAQSELTLQRNIQRLILAAHNADAEQVHELLEVIVPEYTRPDLTGTPAPAGQELNAIKARKGVPKRISLTPAVGNP